MHSPAFAPEHERTGTDPSAVGRVTGVAVLLISDDRCVPVLHRLLVLLQHEEQAVGVAVAVVRKPVRAVLGDAGIVDPARVGDEGVDRSDVVRPDRGVCRARSGRRRGGLGRSGARCGHRDAGDQTGENSPLDDGDRIEPEAVRAHTPDPAQGQRTRGHDDHDDQGERCDGGALADGMPERGHPVMGARHQPVVPAGRTLE